MHEVEAIYFEKNEYHSRKWEKYEKEKAQEMYMRTVNKFLTVHDRQVILTLRDDDGVIVKAHSFNIKYETTVKPKRKAGRSKK